jgi:hypothetical protein
MRQPTFLAIIEASLLSTQPSLKHPSFSLAFLHWPILFFYKSSFPIFIRIAALLCLLFPALLSLARTCCRNMSKPMLVLTILSAHDLAAVNRFDHSSG